MSKPSFFSREVHFAWLLRGDVREELLERCESEEEAQKEFVAWWLLSGWEEYPSIVRCTEKLSSIAMEIVDRREGLPVTRLMRFLLRVRDDVRQNAPPEGTWQYFIRWYFIFGVPEYNLYRWIGEHMQKHLEAPADEIIQDATLPVTRLMYWVWLVRSDLQQIFPLNKKDGRERFLAWFHVFGLKENRLFPYIRLPHVVALCGRLAEFSGIDDPPVSLLMWYVWLANTEIQQRADIDTAGGRRILKKITDDKLSSRQDLQPLWDILNSKCGIDGSLSPEPGAKPSNGRGFGVNLVGYAMGELGIGEDVRMMARALDAVGIEFCVLNRQPGPRIRHMDFSIIQHLSPIPRYEITIICMTAFDTALLWLDRADLFTGTYVIGFWPWELPVWPEEWSDVYDLVDEIWCSSRYTYNAFVQGAAVPILDMPMAVVAETSQAAARAAFGLPEERFLFLFVFDFMSYMARKNPLASVEAFLRAFPEMDAPVNLILKVSNVVEESPAWQLMKTACERDPRIIIIDRTLNRDEVNRLIQVCDAYVSLHRAEGFGRTMAEAMLLGKPVIATGYSGNADFLTESTGYPVGFTLVEIGEEEYPGAKGQVWAEPDIASAARKMREVYENPEQSKRKAFAGKQYILSKHSLEVVGKKVETRLGALRGKKIGEVSVGDRKEAVALSGRHGHESAP